MAKNDVPNLDNATVGFLVDEIGRCRAEQKRFKFLEGFYKQALEARASAEQLNGTSLITGENFVANRHFVQQNRLAADKVAEELQNEPERLARCYNTTEFWQLDVNRIIKEV